MDRTERFYRMLKLLESRRVVSRDAFMDDMSVSRSTFKRDLEYMVERLRAPILYDRGLGGYRLDNPPGAPRFELPGVGAVTKRLQLGVGQSGRADAGVADD